VYHKVEIYYKFGLNIIFGKLVSGLALLYSAGPKSPRPLSTLELKMLKGMIKIKNKNNIILYSLMFVKYIL